MYRPSFPRGSAGSVARRSGWPAPVVRPGPPAGTNACPVRALRTYRQALLDHGHEPTGPMFVRIDRHGRINTPMHRAGRRIGDPYGRMTAEGIADTAAALSGTQSGHGPDQPGQPATVRDSRLSLLQPVDGQQSVWHLAG